MASRSHMSVSNVEGAPPVPKGYEGYNMGTPPMQVSLCCWHLPWLSDLRGNLGDDVGNDVKRLCEG